MRRAADEVSHYLGNTAAVCRSAYIDPRIFDLWQRGRTIRDTLHEVEALADPGELATHGEIEAAVLDLLR